MDMATIKRLDIKYQPHPEYRFWLYDPEGDGMTYYRTKESRDEAGKIAIGSYLDEGWSEEVELISAGDVTHYAQMLDKKMRPEYLDESGCDGEGVYWDDFSFMGTYTLGSAPPNV